jgi:hypothetical protein
MKMFLEIVEKEFYDLSAREVALVKQIERKSKS